MTPCRSVHSRPVRCLPTAGPCRRSLTAMIRPRVFLFVAVLLVSALAESASARGLPEVADLAEREHRAVVNISTARALDPRRGDLPPGFDMPGLEESPFGDLFRRFFGEEDVPRYDNTASLGSGFIISSDGHVLTNAHVVADADEILVRLHDRRQYVAVVVGSDERSDVALLKIEAEDLPVSRIGSPEVLRVGDWVVAIGSPFGFDHSVTAGIVSAKGRSLPNENYIPFIQTDVAINPGNSGGPLFNLDGEVVGVNAQIFSRTGGFMGLSFAIPIDVAMEVAEQLRTEGHVSWGWLGVAIQEVTHDLGRSLGMEVAHGALVSRVQPDSPAEAAGLTVGDVIVGYDGRRVQRSAALPPMVGRTPVGAEVGMTVIRDGERQRVNVTIGRLPDSEPRAELEPGPRESSPAEGS